MDIDETLIQTLSFEFTYEKEQKIHPYNNGDVVIINSPKTKSSITYLRPSLYKFLDYCYKNFIVSFWTSGTHNYCKAILDNILTKKQLEQTSFMFAKFNDNQIIDIKNKKKFKIDKFNGKICKPLDFLFTNINYKDKFNINNTIIVDDNPVNIAINQRNSILIYPWCRFDINDDKLLKLIEIMKKNKNITNIRELNYEPKKLIETAFPNENAHECRFSNHYKDIHKKYLKKRKTKKIKN